MTATISHRDRCAIVGIGATDYSKDSQRSELTLAGQAIEAALGDAGLTTDDVDGLVYCDYDLALPTDVATLMGFDLDYWSAVGPGGIGPAGMVGQAVAAILSGQATTVVVYRALNGRSGRRYGAGWSTMNQPRVGGRQTWDEFFLPYGLVTPGQFFGLLARKHMERYGTTAEDLGAIAIVCRDNALRNPAALMGHRALSMDDYLSARMISDPLRLNDFCLENDGANAVVVTSTDRARDRPQPVVTITAVGQSIHRGGQGGKMYGVLARPDVLTMASDRMATELYRRAGLGPGDVDVAQIYDCFTITTLLQLESYGFCERGEGGRFASSGAIRADGSLPINTSGGHLSEAYIHGMNHVLEGVRQLRGSSTTQVADAEVALVTSAPPIASTAMILSKER